MSATRTQVYLTAEQRRRLDELIARNGKSLAHYVREALDAYLASADHDPEATLTATFGALPALAVPSRDEWDLGSGEG